MQERKPRCTSLSGPDINRVCSRDDVKDWSLGDDQGHPGEFPYAPGVHPTMYQGQFWTMRQCAGFGSADDTNRSFKYLLQHGQTGLSVSFDMPILMWIVEGDSRAHGEAGHCNVALPSLAERDRLVEDIPFDQVTTSMTSNGPAAVILSMYREAAVGRGLSLSKAVEPRKTCGVTGR